MTTRITHGVTWIDTTMPLWHQWVTLVAMVEAWEDEAWLPAWQEARVTTVAMGLIIAGAS